MSRGRFVALSIIVDAVLVNAGFVLAFLIRFGGRLPSFNFEAYLILIPVLTVLFVAAAWVYGLYDPERSDTAWAVARGALAAVTIGTLLTAAIAFFGSTRTAPFARSTMLIAWALDLVLLTGWRLAFLRLGKVKWPEQRVLIVGTDRASVELAEKVAQRERWGWRMIGLVDECADPRHPAPVIVGGFPVVGTVEDVASIASELRANRVISRQSDRTARVRGVARVGGRAQGAHRRGARSLRDLHRHGRRHRGRRAAHGDIPRHRAPLLRLPQASGRPLGLLAPSGAHRPAATGVRWRQSPEATASRPSSPRSGWGGTSNPSGSTSSAPWSRTPSRATGPVIADEDDARITTVGRFLRRFRIDELPQLVNIIKDEMSFVGPRPERPFFVERYLEGGAGLPRALQRQAWGHRTGPGQRQLRHHARAQAQVRPHLHLPSESHHGHPDSHRDPPRSPHGTRRQVGERSGPRRPPSGAPYWRLPGLLAYNGCVDSQTTASPVAQHRH